MSRRESRVSMSVRQNDALVEFENFKKKFLLANKHITKLNSNLGMRIEELNTEISTLYAENLRLRASEIALGAQLKREREKSRKILSDAEAATTALSAHFALLRETFGIPVNAPPSPTPTPPRSSPRSSVVNNNAIVNRLSREPQVPDINEDEEPEDAAQLTPPRKSSKKKERRLSASRLPLPLRASTPPLASLAAPPTTAALPVYDSELPSAPTMRLDLATLTSKKRRQSGLLFDLAVVDLDTLNLDDGAGAADERENEQAQQRPEKEKERKRRPRDELNSAGATTATVPNAKPPKTKLKDVTNADPPRARPSKLSSASSYPPASLDSAATEPLVEPTRKSFLVAAPPSPPPPEPKPAPVPPELNPPSSGSTSSLDSAPAAATTDHERDAGASAGEGEAGGGLRERRARKSVNYAEPKLNTKMRKPEPAGNALAPAPAKRARVSASAAVPSAQPGRRPSPSVEYASRADEVAEADGDGDREDDNGGDDEGGDSDGWADGEFLPAWASGAYGRHANVEGRRAPRRQRRKGGEVDVVVGEWAREREGRRHSAAV